MHRMVQMGNISPGYHRNFLRTECREYMTAQVVFVGANTARFLFHACVFCHVAFGQCCNSRGLLKRSLCSQRIASLSNLCQPLLGYLAGLFSSEDAMLPYRLTPADSFFRTILQHIHASPRRPNT